MLVRAMPWLGKASAMPAAVRPARHPARYLGHQPAIDESLRSWVAHNPGTDEIKLGLAVLPGSGGVTHAAAAATTVTVTVNTSWLRHNCTALLDDSSGQKMGRVGLLAPPCLPREVSLARNELTVVWDADGHRSSFALDWLREHLGLPSAADVAAAAAAAGAVDDDDARAGGPSELRRMDYTAVATTERGAWEWLEVLREHGMCVLTGAGDQPGKVIDLANVISRPQHTIYGETFDVVVEESPINVAYSSLGLPLHQDLVYYESPPGLQMLHCLKFAGEVEGGESTLLDGAELLRRFRVEHPTHFETLCRIPTRFQKVHFERAEPVCMVYHRPIISLGPTGEVSQFTWAPPFEGPLPPQPDVADTAAYYAAYCALNAAIEASDQLIEFRLRQGEVITFNNRRVLHGRQAFSSRDGRAPARHLQGVYVNIDDFRNKHLCLSMTHANAGDPISAAHVWNSDAV